MWSRQRENRRKGTREKDVMAENRKEIKEREVNSDMCKKMEKK